MHPAFSVIFFTTLSGAGYGLMAWLGALVLVRFGGGDALPPRSLAVALALALILVSVGLLSSTLHLGKPMRAWRAFSQWRSSWLSREGVMAVATYVPASALLAWAWFSGAPRETARVWPAIAAGALVVGAALTVVCTAMIYASLKPIPAWRHPLVLPAYFVFAVLTGWLVLMALVNWSALSDAALGVILLVTFALAIVAGVLKLVYWHRIDRQPLGATRGDAVGLPGRDVDVFERPNTQANYINKEMGHVLARKHARPLRFIALMLFVVVPMVASWLAWANPELAGPVFTLGALLALGGTLVERWLFFAQARHLVTLYY